MQRIARTKEQPAAGVQVGLRPAVLGRMPWDVVQDEMGSEAVEILGELARVLHRAAQEEIAAQRQEITAEIGGLRGGGVQEAMGP